LTSAFPVVIDFPVYPGVGPEPASFPCVLQGPALATPALRTIAAQVAKITRLLIMSPLLRFHLLVSLAPSARAPDGNWIAEGSFLSKRSIKIMQILARHTGTGGTIS
jgi:hypothetical protein